MERGINPFKDLISLFKLYYQFKKEKPTIVHSITPKAGLLTLLAGKISFFKNFRYSENLNGVEDADLWIRSFQYCKFSILEDTKLFYRDPLVFKLKTYKFRLDQKNKLYNSNKYFKQYP